jgi:hypothetical protein
MALTTVEIPHIDMGNILAAAERGETGAVSV